MMPEPATQVTPNPPSRPSVRWPSPRLLTGIVLGLTFAVYAQTLGFQFVHDDVGQIVENPAVQSWHYLAQYFTAQVWAGVTPELLGNYYRPLFLIWLRLNDAVFGLHPWAWHLTTLLLHVAVTGLVYLLAWRIVKDRWTALLAALIFGLHLADQQRTCFPYAYSACQAGSSRTLLFAYGGYMDRVFSAMLDRTRSRLDIPALRTLPGARRRPGKYGTHPSPRAGGVPGHLRGT